MGTPLQDVSETVLKQVSSKSLKSGLRKYNPDKCKPYNVARKRPNISPNRLLDFESDQMGDTGELTREA